MEFTDILKNEIKRTINWEDLNIIEAYVKDRELIKDCNDILIWDKTKKGVIGVFKYGKLKDMPIIEDKNMHCNYNYSYIW